MAVADPATATMPSATMPMVTVAGLMGCCCPLASAYTLALSVVGSCPSKYTLGCTVNTLLFSREVPEGRGRGRGGNNSGGGEGAQTQAAG
jgi:hypothetical protein